MYSLSAVSRLIGNGMPVFAAKVNTTPLEFAPGILDRAVEYVENVAGQQDQELLAGLERLADRFGDNHVHLYLGSSSHVALPVVLAGIQAGIIKKLPMVYFTLNGRNPEAGLITHALNVFAERHGVETALLDTNAIHVKVAGDGYKYEPLNEAILDAIRVLSGSSKDEDIRLSLIESIALGGPGLRPGEEARNVPHLFPDGRLGLMHLAPIKPKSFKDNTANMGVNPWYWREQLAERGWLSHFGLSFTWWNHDGTSYRSLGPAKARLEANGDAWLETHGDTFGHQLVIGQPITPSPALRAIIQGILLAVGALPARKAIGDTLSFANQGVISLQGAIEPNFQHPSIYRRGAILGCDAGEKQVFGAVQATIDRMATEIPQGVRLPYGRTEELLREYMNVPSDWTKILEPIRLLDPDAKSASVPVDLKKPTVGATQMAGYQQVLEFFRKLLAETDPRIRREGDDLVMDYVPTLDSVLAYAQATGNTAAAERGELALAQLFVQATPAIFEAVKPYLREAPIYTVVQLSQATDLNRRPKIDKPARLVLKTEAHGTADRMTVNLSCEHYAKNGEMLAIDKTALMIGIDMEMALGRAKPLSEEALAALGTKLPELTRRITPDLRDAYVRASGDENPIHQDDEAAQSLGLPGWIMHGMYSYNAIEQALEDDARGTLKTEFKSVARENDVLEVYRKELQDGKIQVSVVNADRMLIVQATHAPAAD